MRNLIFLIILALIAFAGCSGSNNTPVSQIGGEYALGSSDHQSLINAEIFADGGFHATGIFGAYELTIDPETSHAELYTKRTTTIGEDYIVSGIGFFTMVPCGDCLKLATINLVDGNVILTFKISHPFPAGNTSEDPSASNRLDLDVFDTALVIAPSETTPITYSLMGVDVYTGFCLDIDGYTSELSTITDGPTGVLPYYLVIDDSDLGDSTFNKLAMGTETTFDTIFYLAGPLSFDMYLTMGYGASAKKPGRLNPKYYNPEFNRKAAWKVEVTPPEGANPPEQGNTWQEDLTDAFDVTVAVYDWQHGMASTVWSDPDTFSDAPEDNIYASSQVASVSVEIPGMNTTPPEATTETSGTGLQNDPLIFNVSVPNENLLAAGEYLALVKVLDERLPSADWQTDLRGYLIDTPNGITLNSYNMTEYATYKTFTATVVTSCVEQSLLWDFDSATSPSYTWEGWTAGGCSFPNTDDDDYGAFTFGCFLTTACTTGGVIATGGDGPPASSGYLTDHGENPDYNVVTPSITLPASENSTIEFNHCNAFATDATAYLYISTNGCTGPWEELWNTSTDGECNSDVSADISSYSGTDVMFRFQYVSVSDKWDGGMCGNAGMVIDDVEITGCFDGTLEVN